MTVIPNFYGISPEKSIYGRPIMFVIQGQKVKFKVIFLKILFLINANSSKCNTYLLCDFE